MKITIDTKDLTCKVGSIEFGDSMPIEKKELVESTLRKFLQENTKLSDYEEDSMWMSWRYCIGRKTIAAHMRANDIWEHCKGRMNPVRQLFNAYDVNREIENQLAFMQPTFRFPLISINKIYTPAIDIVCQFMEDYNIKSLKDFLLYKDVNVILVDNEQGYKLEVTTWHEYLYPKFVEFLKEEIIEKEDFTEEYAHDLLENLLHGYKHSNDKVNEFFAEISKDIPKEEGYYRLSDLEDLFVWNDLVHCFDYEHHHKSVLIDGSEVEWFWSWTNKTEEKEDGYLYRTFGYQKIRVPVDKWNGNVVTYIPDEAIINNIY